MEVRGLRFTHKSIRLMGGEGSGHHGHAGRPGSAGGSAPGSGSFGTWSEERVQELVGEMQKKYPEFYQRAEEHVETDAMEPGDPVGGGFLKVHEIPEEISRLTQWDLEHRLPGSDHIKLYSGLYDTTYGPLSTQPTESEWQSRFEKQPPQIMSFTSDPNKAYQFTEGRGSVVIATIPIKSIKMSHFVVPSPIPDEFEFLSELGSRFNVRGQKVLQKIIEDRKERRLGPEVLLGYEGHRPGIVWQGK